MNVALGTQVLGLRYMKMLENTALILFIKVIT